MISTTSSTPRYSLDWRGLTPQEQTRSKTATTKSADSEVAETPSYRELAAKYEKQSKELATLKAGSVASLPSTMPTTAGALDRNNLVASLLEGGRNGVGGSAPFAVGGGSGWPTQGWPMAGMPQGGAVDSSIPTGLVLSPGSFLA